MVLDHYAGILGGERPPAFQIAKKTGDLMRRISEARGLMEHCEICEWRCGVNRVMGGRGRCGVAEARVASEFLHVGEEEELIPSHTIFFAGCNFSCKFCQNWDISQHPRSGEHISPQDLASIIDRRWRGSGEHAKRIDLILSLARWGSKNVNFVGGDPTPNLPYVLEVLSHVQSPIPVIWNSNMYLTERGMSLLDGVIDLYLTDFKYGNDTCAQKLSGVKNYVDVVSRNHLLASKNGDLLIRHLVLPGHLECCTIPVLEWIADHLSHARINIMDQYRPEWKAGGISGLDRRVSYDEYNRAISAAKEILDPVRFPFKCPM